MQRRDFLAGSALGVAAGVVAAEAARPKDSLVQPAEAGRRVLFHCHTFPPNEKRFPRDAATGLFPGSPEHLAGFCRKLGFTGAMAISPFEVPAGRCTARVEEGTDGPAWLAERAAPLAGRLLLFAGLDPSKPESASRLEILAETGFSGVKLHPPICHFSLDVDRDAAFYTTLERLSLPLLIHTGVLSGYMHWPLEYYHPLLIDKLAGRHPGIPIIMAHCGGAAFCRDVLAVVQNHGQAYIDLTHSLDPKYAWYVPKSEYELIFNTVGPGRVIFGVDYPWYAPEEFERDLKILESLGISGRDLDRVLSENFLGLLENKPG